MFFTQTSKVFVLTGAGISAESGIRTFRDANGLWEEHRVEDVASPEGFARDPKLVWKFYAQRRKQALGVKPNPAHVALARWQQRLALGGGRVFLCTQNVDDLHEQAGKEVGSTTPQILHMHGELFATRCSKVSCTTLPFRDERFEFTALPRCECGALQRPHIVWFGEIPFEMDRIKHQVRAADVFITVGSSGAVYPAAGLVREMEYRKARGESATSIYVGLERPENASSFDQVILGKAGEVLPGLIEAGQI